MKNHITFILTVIITSCTGTKGIEVESIHKYNTIPVIEGRENAKRNYDLISKKIESNNSDFVEIGIPRGVFYIEGSIHNDNKRLLIYGQDKFLSKLIFITGGFQALVFSKSGSSYLYGSKIQNLSIFSKDANAVIKIEKQRGFRFKNVNVTGGKIGIHIDFVYDLLMSDIYISQFSKSGLKFTSKYGTNTTCYLEHSHIEGHGDGIQVEGTSGLRIEKTIIQSNQRGIVELDNLEASTMFIRDCHFEGNEIEAIKEERSFKPGKSPSHINIENTYLLKGKNTREDAPVIFMDFGSLNMINSSTSYITGVKRSEKSIGTEYAIDNSEINFFENPIRRYFEYPSKSKNKEFYKIYLTSGEVLGNRKLLIRSKSDSNENNSKVMNLGNQSVKLRRSTRPGIFEITAFVPYKITEKNGSVSCALYVNNKKITADNIESGSSKTGSLRIKEDLELGPNDDISCQCNINEGTLQILEGGYLSVSRKITY